MAVAAALVLTEDEALELLAFLVTSARTQVNEPNEYAPLRMLTAARRLGEFMSRRASIGTQQLLAGPLTETPPSSLYMSDRRLYLAQLDALCNAVVAHQVRHVEPEAERP